MRKFLMGAAMVAISMSVAGCNKSEPAANEAVVEEPMANESMDANLGANATDMNATDMNAADANATDSNAADSNAAQ